MSPTGTTPSSATCSTLFEMRRRDTKMGRIWRVTWKDRAARPAAEDFERPRRSRCFWIISKRTKIALGIARVANSGSSRTKVLQTGSRHSGSRHSFREQHEIHDGNHGASREHHGHHDLGLVPSSDRGPLASSAARLGSSRAFSACFDEPRSQCSRGCRPSPPLLGRRSSRRTISTSYVLRETSIRECDSRPSLPPRGPMMLRSPSKFSRSPATCPRTSHVKTRLEQRAQVRSDPCSRIIPMALSPEKLAASFLSLIRSSKR